MTNPLFFCAGAKAAALVGGATFSASFRAAAVLLTFFYTSSKLTRYCEDRKLDDESFKKGGQRDWKQVPLRAALPFPTASSKFRHSRHVVWSTWAVVNVKESWAAGKAGWPHLLV